MRSLKQDASFSLGIPSIIWQGLFFYLPLAILVISSFIEVSTPGSWQKLSFDKFALFFQASYFTAIGYSLLLAFVNVVLCIAVAYPLAYFLAFKAGRWKTLLLFLIAVPFWTNFLLHVYAWYYILDYQGAINQLLLALHWVDTPLHLLNTPAAICVMMLYYYVPFMILPLYAALERFDIKLLEASLDLGATRFQTFYKIVLPMSKNGLRAGIFLVFIPSFGEFAIPELLGGDRYMFVGTVISHYILGDQTGSLGAAFAVLSAVIMLIASGILYLAYNRLFQRRRHGL